MTTETSNARGEWSARYMANGPQGTFYTDDLRLADALLHAYDEDADWTVTDMLDPTGTIAAPPAAARGDVLYDRELIAEMLDVCGHPKFTLEAYMEQARLLRDADNADAANVGTGRLSAAQQQGQATPPSAPMQQGGGDATFAAWLATEMPAGTVIGDPAWWANRISRQYAKRCAPPSAPVGVEGRAREAVALALDEAGHHTEANNVRKGIDLDEYRTELLAARIALAQQPAAVDGAMVMVQKRDALILANFATTHGGAMEQLAARRITSLATQHQEPTT